jgi:hypothetical protein
MSAPSIFSASLLPLGALNEERRKLDANPNRDGEVSRILQRSSMTAEHNEIVNGLYSLLSARSFKYAPQCILREEQNLSIVS